MPTQTTTPASAPGPALVNPYQSGAVPALEIEIILLAALACFVVGMLLAERRILRGILASIDRALQLPQREQSQSVGVREIHQSA